MQVRAKLRNGIFPCFDFHIYILKLREKKLLYSLMHAIQALTNIHIGFLNMNILDQICSSYLKPM